MSHFSDLIFKRQSVRRFSPRKVEPEKLLECVEAARLAPSASNSQPWSLVIVDEPALVQKVADATFDNVIAFNRFVLQAPAILVLIIEPSKLITKMRSFLKSRNFQWTDHGILAAHFCLKAAELDLGTCMLGWFNEKKVKQLLRIPRRKRLSLLIAVGYPMDEYPVRKKIRKPLQQILSFNKYQQEVDYEEKNSGE